MTRVIPRLAVALVCALAVGTALYWGFLRDDAAPSGPRLRIAADFTRLPDGDMPATFDTGQPLMTSNANVAEPNRLKILDGTATFTPTAKDTVAGYISTPNMTSPVRKLDSTWVFRPGKGTYGAIALVVSSDVASRIPQVVPPFAMHLVITPINWNVSIKDPSVTKPLEVIGRGIFGKPLATDGTTAHTVSVRIDGGTMTIALPDGGERIVRDPRISQWRGNFATFEVFDNHGTTDSSAGFRTIAAEAGE